MKEGFLLAVVLALPAAAQAQLKPGPYLQLEFADVRSGTTGVKTLSGASPRDTIAVLDKSGAGIVVGWGLPKKGKNTLAVEWGGRTWGTTKNSPSHQLFGDGTYLRAAL